MNSLATGMQTQRKTRRDKASCPVPSCSYKHPHKGKLMKRLLSVVLVGYCQFLTTLCAACCQHATTILCCHSLAESMLVHATTIVRLKCSFHCSFLFCFVVISSLSGHNNPLLGCKSTHKFLNSKVLCNFYAKVLCFFLKSYYLCTRFREITQ